MKTVFPEGDASYRFDLEGIGFVEVQVRNAQCNSVSVLRRTAIELAEYAVAIPAYELNDTVPFRICRR